MKRRATGIILAVLLILTLSVGSVQAQTVSPMTSNNLYSHDYLLYRSYNRPWNWADTILSYLIAHEDGSYTRVEATSDYGTDEATRCVTIETYSSAFSITSQKQIPFELPLFGGFYEGSDYYFLVFGQNNPNDADDREVVRVVRYTKNWQRKDAVSISGANTYIPFDAGCLRMVEADGMLYIHTCHEMYETPDKLHHQANMTFTVRISDMTLTDSNHRVWNIGGGYVSHSFNQFIARDGNDLVTADHGDAYPRSVVLCRYSGGAGSQTLNAVSYINVLNIRGKVGDNDTGVQVGALQVSDTHYLVAGTSVAQDDTYDPKGTQNVFLTATPKDNFTEAATTLTYFTHEPLDSQVKISNPYLVRISGTKFLLMWNMDDILNYQFVDGSGQPISEVKTMNAQLSDCVPVVAGDQVVWYATNNSAPMFFTIDLSGKAHTHSYVDGICTVCGEPDPNALFNISCVSMNLGNSLSMIFYVPVDNVTDGDYAQIIKSYADGRDDVTVKVPLAGAQTKQFNGVNCYLAGFDRIAAKEMNDNVSCVVCHADGTPASKPYNATVKAYAEALLTINDAKLKTLMVDLLNYGAAAQKAFGYDTGNPANKDLTDEQKGYATKDIDVNALAHYQNISGIAPAEIALLLKSNTRLMLYYPAAGLRSNMVAEITYTDHHGTEKISRVNVSDFGTDKAGKLCLIIDTLLAADYKTVLTVEIYDGENLVSSNEVNLVMYCVLNPGYDASIPLAKYCQAAYNYFHK